jgi:hypothetical protein
MDALLKEDGLTPRHRNRYALNGFAHKRVITVESDGIANICDQTIPWA